MELPEALYALGERDESLSTEEKNKLDTEGYLFLPGILSSAQIAAIHGAMEKLYAAEKTGTKG